MKAGEGSGKRSGPVGHILIRFIAHEHISELVVLVYVTTCTHRCVTYRGKKKAQGRTRVLVVTFW